MSTLYTVEAIPAFKDNYIWVILEASQSLVWVVDPGDADPVFHFLQKHQLQLAGIFITHHHADHCGGVKSLLDQYTVPVYGPKHKAILASKIVQEGEVIFLENSQSLFKVLAVPGHTLDHIAYYCASEKWLFCGDTLFSAGCGRIFEGTAAQLYESLQRFKILPDDIKVYCAHEYTQSNLQFAAVVEPDNEEIVAYLHAVKNIRALHQSSLPSTIGLEKKINPFLRTEIAAVIKSAENQAGKKLGSPVEVFAALREWKNFFIC